MRLSASITVLVLVATGLLVLVGCQSAGESGVAEKTQVQSMSIAAGPSGTSISPEMQRFDSGIGDTATGVGGGGAQR